MPALRRTRLFRSIASLLRCQDGTTTVEYALLLGLVAGACLASIMALGPAAGETFRSTNTTVGTYGVP